MIKIVGQILEADGESMPLYSKRAFEILSSLWLKVSWSQKYSYYFSWMGRPIIQLPQDMVRIQEIIYQVRPAFIVETGVAHGGSIVFYASLCKAMGCGHVVGVDIEIREANRLAFEAHELSPYFTLIEGNSVDSIVVQQVKNIVGGSACLVVLDSNHSKAHVAAELEAYHGLVSVGSYLVVTDGVISMLHDVPQGQSSWEYDNPLAARDSFLAKHHEFVLQRPEYVFSGNDLTEDITHWSGAWLKRV